MAPGGVPMSAPAPTCWRCPSVATFRKSAAVGGGNYAITRACGVHAKGKGWLRAYPLPHHARPSPTRHLRPLDPSLFP